MPHVCLLIAAVVAAFPVAAILAAGLLLRARSDRLTGLANRDRFRAAARRALTGADRHTGILLVDLHDADEAVLRAFALLLRRCVPHAGLLCRLDVHRFAVVLPGLTALDQAYDVAGRIAASLGPVPVGGRLVAMTAGIGVAVSAPGELTVDELVQRAEAALGQASRLAPETRWAAWQPPLAAAA